MPPSEGTAPASEEGMAVDMAELERSRAFKADVERALGIEQGSSEAATLKLLRARYV